MRGMGFGLAYAVTEITVGYLPIAMRMHLQAPLHAILKSLAFDLVFFALLGLMAAPLLRRKRGSLLHTLALTAMLAAISAYLSPRFMTAILLVVVVVLVTLALHALALKLANRPALARLRVPAAVILLVAAFTLPKLAVPAPPELPEPTSQPPAGAPNLLLIVTDTVRADHLDLYGYERETAPTLARIAREGTVFDRAIASSTWTVPSHASMFTGKYPSAHGAHHEGNLLPYENTTLAEVLHANGYTTVGFNSNPFMTDSNGFTQGFERMDPSWLMMTAPMLFLPYRIGARSGLVFEDHGAREVTDRFLKWFGEEWDGETPFFTFLNYIESHFPYHTMPPGARDRFLEDGVPVSAMRNASDAVIGGQMFGDAVSDEDARLVRDLYDAGIRYEDGLIAHVIDALRERGTLDNTVLMIVSDHGELFGEHGLYGHEMSLSEHLIRVPFIVRYPGRVQKGWRIATPVSTVSLFATALDLVGVSPPEPPQAPSLAPLFAGRVAPRAPILAEQHRYKGNIPGTYKPQGPFDQLNVRYRALEEDGWKLIVDSTGNQWLYRPRSEPEELVNHADAEPEVVARLAARLEAVVKGLGLGDIDAEKLGPGGDVELDPAARERLKALGYVQ